MAGYDETSWLRTLADAVGAPSGSDSDDGGEQAASGEVEAAKVLSGNGFPVDEVEDGEYVSDHGFSAGDLVWGKIKSHPWWPGQIYDSRQASEYALKFNQKGRLLVAYFGDGSFAWCLPSQLIPFAEHYVDMSTTSSSKVFVTAVQEAVDEVGRLVEMEMVCKCVGEEDRKGMETPVSQNAGIQAGAGVPQGELGKLLSFRYDSGELLAAVQGAAEGVSFPNALELGILKSSLSAFNRSRGSGYPLPVWYEGILVEGLEDKSKNQVLLQADAIESVDPFHQGPREEDWPSALVSDHKRKQKSVAEIMGAVSEVKVKSATERKRGRKRIEKTGSGELAHNVMTIQVKDGETDSAAGNREEGIRVTGELSSPRERKRSKYLSPPFTDPQFGAAKLSTKKESESGSVGLTKKAGGGESMTKAAGILLQAPLVNSGGQENIPPKTPLQVKKIEAADVNASPKEVLEGIVSVASRPNNSWDENMLVSIRGFMTTFRSCCYHEGAYYKTFHKSKRGRKRKSVEENGGVQSSEAKQKKAAKSSVLKLNEKKVQGNAFPEAVIVERRPLQQLDSVRQKLEGMTSMVEKCDGKISKEEVANLETEMEMLYDKVRKMSEAV